METEEHRIQRVYANYNNNKYTSKLWSVENAGNRANTCELWNLIVRGLQKYGIQLANKRILDLGCGTGRNLNRLRTMGAMPHNLFGVDLIADRIQNGKALWPELNLTVGNGVHLEFKNEHFDILMVFTVFSSILEGSIADRVCHEMRRVLRPDGFIIWYDIRFNNPWNANVYGIRMEKILYLFPGFQINLQTLTLLPPLARRLGFLTSILHPLLKSIPLLRTHYLGFFKKEK